MKKLAYFMTYILFVLSLNIVPIQAQDITEVNPTTIDQPLLVIQPRADIPLVSFYYNESTNIHEYRIWNSTQGYWMCEWTIYTPPFDYSILDDYK